MGAYAAIINLKFSINRLLNHFDVCLDPPSLEIAEFLLKEAESFQKFLRKLNSNSRNRMNASLEQIASAIRRFDEAIISLFEEQALSQYEESSDLDVIKPYLFSIDLLKLKQDGDSLSAALKEVEERFNSLMPQSSCGGLHHGGIKSKMVGMCDEYDKFKEELIGEWNRFRKSFAIVGMAGIGKTTLAKENFEDIDTAEYFDCRVWVTVGRQCQSSQIPRAVLARVDGIGEAEEDDQRIGDCLKEKLDDKRYLIVLDDVCDAQIYHDLSQLLPNNEGDGSKILFTTIVKKVAQQVTKLVGPNSAYSLGMRLLDKEESWDLLREKLFGEDPCPPQLVKAGKKIAEHCDGLPLMIVTVANLFSGAEKAPERWSEIAAERNHILFIDAYEEISKVLYPSYEYLPQHLKACFLYMGVFPQNYEISKSKLINMWIVEEIIEQNMKGDIEEYALECLEELASNSLVMVYKESKSNRSSLKTCGLHSCWWHLCCKEARKNNFFHILNHSEDGLGQQIKGQTRLSVQNNVLFAIKDVHDSIEENCAFTAKSLLCLSPYHQYQVPICLGLSLLQKLDALTIRLYEFPLEVLELSLLRYLALTCDEDLPTPISKLSNLHFLIINRHLNVKPLGISSYLPISIWDMKELKHLQITGSDLQDLHHKILPNLSTLLGVSDLSCTKTIFQSLPKLKRLGIRIALAPDAVEQLCCFDHICLLNKLKSLKCEVVNPEYSPEVVTPLVALSALPLSLRKLTLSGLGCPWKEMKRIASLPKLEVLKLRCNAFQGPKWEVEGFKFMKLKYLLIEDCDVERLIVGKRRSLRKLKCLSIRHCYKLEELYWNFSDNLRQIEVLDCDPLFEKQMKEALLWKMNFPDDYSFSSSWGTMKRPWLVV